MFKSQYFLMTCREIFRYYREKHLKKKSTVSTRSIWENLHLFLYGIEFPTNYAEDYPIHNAIFENNIPLIRSFAKNRARGHFYYNINAADLAGVSPLLLSIILDRKVAFKILLTADGINPTQKATPFLFSPVEQAVLN